MSAMEGLIIYWSCSVVARPIHVNSLPIPCQFPVNSLPIPCQFPANSLPIPCQFPVNSLSIPCQFPANSPCLCAQWFPPTVDTLAGLAQS